MSYRARLLSLALVALWLAAPTTAGVIVLKNGSAIRTRGGYVIEGRRVVFYLEDGTYVSLRLNEIDLPRTERANLSVSGATEDAEPPETGAPAEPDEVQAARPQPRAPEPVEPEPYDVEAAAARLAAGERVEPVPFGDLVEDAQLLALLHTAPRRDPVIAEPAPVAAAPEPSELAADTSARRLSDAELLALLDEAARAPEPEVAADVAGGLVHTGRSGPREELFQRLTPPPPPDPELESAAAWAAAREVAAVPEVEVASLTPPAVATLGGFALVAPRDGAFVLGPTEVRVEVEPAARQRVARVELSVDGRLLAVRDAPPYSVVWEAPERAGSSRVEAAVWGHDGTRELVSARVRTIEPDAELDVGLVPLHVTVTDVERRFVRGLDRGSFVLLEDGVEQEIRHFSREPIALSVALLVDLSFSMNGARMQLGLDAARGFLDLLEPGDRVGLWAFDHEVREVTPVGTDPEAVMAGIGTLESGGGTSMFDAVLDAIQALEQQPGKRVVIILSDGEDYHSVSEVDDVLAAASRANALIYGVGVAGFRVRGSMPRHWTSQLLGDGRPKHWTDKLRVRGIKLMRELTDATGAVLYLPRYLGELPYVYRHIHEELRNQYNIGYYPSQDTADTRFRRIDLKVKSEEFKVRTRAGYTPTPQPSDHQARLDQTR